MRRLLALVATTFLVTAAPAQVPRLALQFTTTSIDAAPIDRLTPIAVGPQGNVLVASNTDPATRLLLLDSTGRVLLRFGHQGAGPGEVNSPQPVAVTGKSVAVWDRGNGRFTEWSLTGAPLGSTTPDLAFEAHDATDAEVMGLRNVGGVWRLSAYTRGSGKVRDMLMPNDSFAQAHFTAGNRFAPLHGSWSGGVVLADAANYRIAVYGKDGTLLHVLSRDVPPAHPTAARTDEFIGEMLKQAAGRGTPPQAQLDAMRERALKETLPALMPGSPIHADGRGRFWVTGMEGDSAFADVFSADRFIGRIHVPCHFYNGFSALSGHWFAVACVPDDPAFDGDAVIKLFRIDG